ncbi:unnamed protein product [Parnassius apollo]|uniref:(apollo) hypothetical protein n=1 Tax=Parnassius apollo TaxID=110799 RepID=A0A8S3X8G7_PARAO|nr:unnamed protein product [Parnassius apollo]
MERGKISTGRGGKSKAPQHPQDIFALGSKSTVVVSRDAEKRNIHKPSSSGVERKRETSGFGSQPPSKKSRIGSPAETVGGTSLDVEPVDLVPNVLQALDTHNSDKLLGLLTGSIRLLKSQRSKPDIILCMSMLYLTKIRPNMFAHETVTQSLCTLLKREQGAAFKNKGNPLVFVLACNMLYAGHKDSTNWPDTFIKVYIEDALNERWWVDCSWCKCLVENIVTAFGTKQPPSHLIPTDNTLGSGSPLMGSTDEDTDNTELEYSVFPRYTSSYETVEALVLEAIKEQIQRRTAPDTIGKGFLKLLSATCGFPEIRMIAASRLEAWLHSGKLWRAAQELLAHVCANAAAAGPSAARDHEVLAQLARMRLKTKPLQTAYQGCLRSDAAADGPSAARDHEVLEQLAIRRLKTKPLQTAYQGCLRSVSCSSCAAVTQERRGRRRSQRRARPRGAGAARAYAPQDQAAADRLPGLPQEDAAAAGPSAARDHEVLAQLARMRLKTKPLQTAYQGCLRSISCSSCAAVTQERRGRRRAQRRAWPRGAGADRAYAPQDQAAADRLPGLPQVSKQQQQRGRRPPPDETARDHEALAQSCGQTQEPAAEQLKVDCGEMVSESPALLRSVVTHTIYNELSNARSPNNMAVLAALIHAQPQLVPAAIAETYQELLFRAEDYLRPMRAMLRECVRAARAETQALLPLAAALAAPPPHDPPPEVRERAFQALADLFCCCCSVTAALGRQQAAAELRAQLCALQQHALAWLLDTAAAVYRPARHDYQLALNKVPPRSRTRSRISLRSSCARCSSTRSPGCWIPPPPSTGPRATTTSSRLTRYRRALALALAYPCAAAVRAAAERARLGCWIPPRPSTGPRATTTSSRLTRYRRARSLSHIPAQQLCALQQHALAWLLDTAAAVYRPARHDYQLALNKVPARSLALAYPCTAAVRAAAARARLAAGYRRGRLPARAPRLPARA